jgi:short-subunit dehydrogenase
MKLTSAQQQKLETGYGPWALVTGASSGIGMELARQLASAGFHLVINARNKSQLEELASELSAQHDTSVRVVSSDMSNEEGVNKLIAAVDGLDIGLLVVSAGFGTSGSFLHSSVHEEVNLLRVNCESLLVLTHHFSQHFARQKRGGIILMSSMVAFQGVPFAANYAASKAYVQSLAEALSTELKPHGVDVLAAAPGPVSSGFGRRANMQMELSLSPAQVGVPILRALGKRTTVLPGWLTKLLVYSLRTVPRWGKIKIMKKVMGGMTKHQRSASS